MRDSKRLLTLDLLRGYFLLVIFTDHLFRFPNIFEIFTGRGQLWVSAAEGFFIISGLLVGYLHLSWAKLWKRAGQIYLLSIGLTALFTLWGQLLPADKIKSGLWTQSGLVNFLFKTATFQYVYGWADFLVYYAVFMFVAPLALLTMKKFHGLGVVAISLIAWYFFRSANYHFAWQIFFMFGLVAGDKLLAIESEFRSLGSKTRVMTGGAMGIATILSVAISVWFVFRINRDLPLLFDKNTVGPGRFILAWLWFATLYLFVRSHEAVIDKLTAGVLRIIGQKSLFVYCLQAIILFPISVLIPFSTNFWQSSLIALVGYLLIYLIVTKQKQFVVSVRNIAVVNSSSENRWAYALQIPKVFLLALLARAWVK